MLFVPPGIPFMVPEAEAQSNDTGGATPDITDPTVNVPSSIARSTTNSTGYMHLTFTATASDDVGVTSGPTCSPSSGSTFPVGVTTVTCTASDAAGNEGTGTITVTVNYTPPADTTPPVVTVPSDQTFTTQSGQKDYSFQTSATDNVGVTSSDCRWHYNESVAGDPSGWYGTFSIGTST